MLLGVVARAFRRIADAAGFEFTTALGSPTATVAYQGNPESVDVETALGSPFAAKGHQGSAAAYAFDTALGSPTAITGKSGSAEAFAIVTGMGSPTATVAYQGIPADIETVIEVPSIATGYVYTNTEAQTFEDNADGTGWDDTLRGDIDTLISDLKNGRVNSSSTYSDFGCIMLLNMPNAVDQLLWLNSPTTSGTAVNSPTHTANRGSTGNGTTSYIETNYNLATDANWTQNSASMGAWARDIGTVNNFNMYLGASNSFVGHGGSASAAWSGLGPNGGGAAGTTATDVATGLLGSNRSASNAIQRYRNGVLEASDTDSSSAVISRTLWVHALNNGVGGSSFGSGQVSIIFAGASFTANEWADIHDAFDRFYTAREAV